MTPACVLFGAWVRRAFYGASALLGASADAGHLDADMPSLEYRFSTFLGRGLVATKDWRELYVWLAVALLLGLAITLGRRFPTRGEGPPVLEMAALATVAGAFFLPENLATHEVIASRNVGIAAWLAPVFAAPVAAAASRAWRGAVVAAMVAIGVASTVIYRDAEDAMRAETAGLREVLDAMPPRLRLHMVKLDTNSAYFPERALWHVEKIYMAEKFGTTPDTPAILATGAVHLRPGVDPHWIRRHSAAWPLDGEIWDNFDLVLVRKWYPTPILLGVAQQRGRLLKKSGDWEVWQTKR